jgi:hypothetical protein
MNMAFIYYTLEQSITFLHQKRKYIILCYVAENKNSYWLNDAPLTVRTTHYQIQWEATEYKNEWINTWMVKEKLESRVEYLKNIQHYFGGSDKNRLEPMSVYQFISLYRNEKTHEHTPFFCVAPTLSWIVISKDTRVT